MKNKGIKNITYFQRKLSNKSTISFEIGIKYYIFSTKIVCINNSIPIIIPIMLKVVERTPFIIIF